MSNTHRLDKWMVKFLLQHALALDDKGKEGPLDHSLLWLRPSSGSPPSSSFMPEDTGLIERSRVAESIIKDMRMRQG